MFHFSVILQKVKYNCKLNIQNEINRKFAELFAHVVNDAAIEFPADEDWPMEPNAKDLITTLLQQNPQDRLGSAGPQEVKEHPYLIDLDWNSLLRYKVSCEGI